MSLKVIAGQSYEDVCVFQYGTGNIYVAMRDTDTPEPIELVANPDMFTYGCVEGDSKSELFNTIMRFYETHDLAPWDVSVTDIFNGYCKAFRFPNWDSYDYHNECGVLFITHKSLGTAKQWMDYSNMWDMKDVWRVIDTANNKSVSAIYADNSQDAVELFLNKGASASLETIINNARENWSN